jgi:hypothetical protein
MEFAFTDDLVRRDREVLTDRVLAYLQSYTGEFGPLIQARNLIKHGVSLNVAQVRTVLNAMRADTSVVMDYQPPIGAQVISFPRTPRMDLFAPDVEDEPYEPPARRWFKHDFRFKLPYAMATAARAEVIHLLSQERSILEYHPIGSWYDGKKVFGQPIWNFRLYYECTQASKKLRMLTEHEAEVLVDLGLMRYCRTCQQFRAMRGGGN